MKKIISFLYNLAVKFAITLKLDRLKLVKSARDLYVGIFKSDSVVVDGHRIFLDSEDSLRLSIHGVYEPCETDFIKKIIKKKDVVVDIGANIGYYTLIFASLVSDKGKVFAFEPDPENFALLIKNIQINGYKNIISEQKAVSDIDGKVRLFQNNKNKSDHRIYDSNDNRKAIEVDAVNINDYFRDTHFTINLIKIDIQGAEIMALQNIDAILKKNMDIRIITEFWPFGISKVGRHPEDYLKMLSNYGFKFYNINEDAKKIEPVDKEHLLKIYTPDNRLCTNLFCVKKYS